MVVHLKPLQLKRCMYVCSMCVCEGVRVWVGGSEELPLHFAPLHHHSHPNTHLRRIPLTPSSAYLQHVVPWHSTAHKQSLTPYTHTSTFTFQSFSLTYSYPAWPYLSAPGLHLWSPSYCASHTAVWNFTHRLCD